MPVSPWSSSIAVAWSKSCRSTSAPNWRAWRATSRSRSAIVRSSAVALATMPPNVAGSRAALGASYVAT